VAGTDDQDVSIGPAGHSKDVRATLLAVQCFSRQAEITDALVELLVALVHKINAHAERRVETQLTDELKKVRGNEGILFRLAEVAVGKPDEIVRRALSPVVGRRRCGTWC
jgi:hypothetical protein